MITLSIPKSMKNPARLTLIAASLAMLASCSSTGRTALDPGVEAQSSTATAAEAPSDATIESTTTQPALPETTATVAPTPDPTATAPTTAATEATTATPVDTVSTTAPSVTTPPTTTVPAPPTSADPIAAVDANGDAVLVGPDGAITVLYDGVDFDDPEPEEGEADYLDGIAVTDDLSTRIVGTCCEPVPGWLTVSSDSCPLCALGGFGHGPAISPDQTQLAAITIDAIFVSRFDLSGLHDISIETAGAAVLDIEWIDDANVVVLVSSPTEAALYRYQVTDEGLVATAVVSVPVASALAGVYDGVVYAIGDTATLAAYAADTFAPLPERDIALPAAPLSASIHDGELRWVDQERNLHIGDSIIPGQFIWVA